MVGLSPRRRLMNSVSFCESFIPFFLGFAFFFLFLMVLVGGESSSVVTSIGSSGMLINIDELLGEGGLLKVRSLNMGGEEKYQKILVLNHFVEIVESLSRSSQKLLAVH